MRNGTLAESSGLSEKRFRGLLALFLVSGAAGLVDQVCFSKYLSYVVGATAYAVSAVLAAFMTGLALGASVAGRLSRRATRPLVAYGMAELVVGATVALTPLAFAVLTPLYVGAARAAHGSLATLSVLRWGLAMAFVVIPTAAMGATLPLISPLLASPSDPDARKRRLNALYAANTAGGAVGALAGAYVVLPTLGLSKTVLAAALTSAVAGAVAIVLGRRAPAAVPEVLQPNPSPSPAASSIPAASADSTAAPSHRWPFVLSFGSGYLTFATEVVSTHLLAVVIGSSAYAFGLILAAFLASLFVGASIAPALSRRLGDRALAASLSLTGLSLAVSLPFWDMLPLAFAGLGEFVTTFAGREAMRALIAFAILVLPATAMGLTFPLLLRLAAGERDVGHFIGRLTSINTLGAVTGALLTGYVVLPALGSQHTLVATALVFAGLGLATIIVAGGRTTHSDGSRAARGRRSGAPALLAFATAAVALFAPRWDLGNLTLGTNVYFDGQKPPDAILSVREDVHGGITTVTIRDGVHTLYTNGKFQGNDGWELNAQRYFAHYPCLFVPQFGDGLVIGYGTGTTLGTLTAYPWRSLDLLEISPSIVATSREYFAGPSRDALDDPRVHLTLDDARNHLLVHEGRYDFIGMELTSVWFAGAASLYSSEYYRLVKAHLKPEGVFQQWVQMHHVYPPVFAVLVNTLRQEFPHVALFFGGGQGILVASQRPLRWSLERAERLTRDEKMQPVLPGGRALELLTRDVLVTGDGLDRFLANMAASAHKPLKDFVSTDDNLYLEYETPRGNVLPWLAREALVEQLRTYHDPVAIDALAETTPGAASN
jgi:spermidine synthase